jgi:hypothetical protein
MQTIPGTNATFPSTPSSRVPIAKSARVASYVFTGLAVLFLLFDAVMKLVKIQPVIDATVHVGFSEDSIRPIGLTLLVCVVLHLVPRTSVFGAVLLTGYLGGAIATHVRLGDPLFTHALFPSYFAVFVWLGLYLRDPRVRAIAPWSSRQ